MWRSTQRTRRGGQATAYAKERQKFNQSPWLPLRKERHEHVEYE
ncbi:MAG: hypothetical protein ACTSU5_07435 [Promethearchaeota archaeon]